MFKLIIFDLDGTLAESKQPLTGEMATLFAKLLAVTKVGVASGGALPQFIKQIVDRLPRHTNLANLYLLPTSGAALYEFDPSTSFNSSQDKSLRTSWNKIYEERLTEKEENIIDLNLLDPLTLIVAAEPGTGTVAWIQNPDLPQLRRVLLDANIVYLSYSNNLDYDDGFLND